MNEGNLALVTEPATVWGAGPPFLPFELRECPVLVAFSPTELALSAAEGAGTLTFPIAEER